MERVFVVTSGEYSAYEINAVFSTREKAEAFQTAVGADDIEEWELDRWPNVCERKLWTVELTDATARAWSHCPSSLQAEQAIGVRRWGDGVGWRVSAIPADTASAAIKIAAEQVAMAKAQMAGMGD